MGRKNLVHSSRQTDNSIRLTILGTKTLEGDGGRGVETTNAIYPAFPLAKGAQKKEND